MAHFGYPGKGNHDGFPPGLDIAVSPKGYRQSHPLETHDERMSLLGNAWHVGIVCNLLQPLCHQLGLIPFSTVSDIMNRVKLGGSQDVAGKLLRPRIKSSLPLKPSTL